MGYGSAKIDLILQKNTFMLEEEVNGELLIQGGNVTQQINKIDVDLMLSIYKDDTEHSQRIERFPFHQSFQIQPGEQRSFPFSYRLPHNLPISAASVQFYFITKLDIAGGVDSSDRDYIQIEPPASLQQVLAALNQLGFHEKHDSREFEGYAQEFELAPISGPFAHEVKELEFFASLEPDGVYLLLEVEKKSFMGTKEVKQEVRIANEILQQPDELVAFLNQVITDIMQHEHTTFGFQNSDSHSHVSRFPTGGHSMSSALGGAAIGAIGGIAAGIFASKAIDSMMDDDEENEIGFLGNHDSNEETENFFASDEDEENRGFFGDDNGDSDGDEGDFFGGEDVSDDFFDDD